jgi:hypothetical protein
LEKTHISKPPLATKAILIAALPALLREWAIFPPSSFDAASVWKVLHFDGKVGDVRDEPYSTAILVLALEHSERDWSSLRLSEREGRDGREEGRRRDGGRGGDKRTELVRDQLMVWIYQ